MERILGIPIPYLGDIKARLAESPIAYRLARGAFWSLVGAVISRGLGLLSSILVARMLGKEGFGELGIIQSTIGMFGTFAGFGLGLTATKHIAELRQKDPPRAGQIIALSASVSMVTGGLMAVLLFALAPWLAAHTLAAPHLAGLLRVGAILLFLGTLNGAQTGALAGFEAFRSIARVNLLAGISAFPFVAGGTYLYGLAGAVWGLVASVAVNWLLNHLALKAQAQSAGISFSLSGFAQEYKVLWNFSFPAALMGLMVGPVNWICSALLVNQPNGYAEMGIYNAACAFQGALWFLAANVSAPLLPMISSPTESSCEWLGKANMLATWGLGLLPAVALMSFPELAQMLYGNQYSGTSLRRTYVLILFFTCIVLYKQGFARVMVAKNLMWWSVLSNAFWGAVSITGAFFMSRWGSSGLAASFAIAYVLNTIIFIPLFTKRRLIPKTAIVSWEIAIIWLIISILVGLTWFNSSLLVRSIFFIPGTLVIVASFWCLLQPNPLKSLTK